MPGLLGRVHEGRRTPWVAIVFTTLLAVVLISIGTLEDLAVTTVILLLLVFTMVNIAVLVLRRERVDHAHFTTRAVFPVLGIVISLVLLIKLATDQNLKVFVITAIVLAVGVLLWVVTRLLGTERAATTPTYPGWANDEPVSEWRPLAGTAELLVAGRWVREPRPGS